MTQTPLDLSPMRRQFSPISEAGSLGSPSSTSSGSFMVCNPPPLSLPSQDWTPQQEFIPVDSEAKQKLTYHGAILLEWDHGKYMTVVELATLYGVGGRKGKVNWHHDKPEPVTALYRAMSSHMIAPWKGKYAEVRVTDVPAKNLTEFQK